MMLHLNNFYTKCKQYKVLTAHFPAGCWPGGGLAGTWLQMECFIITAMNY
jgi:hypothetical protein